MASNIDTHRTILADLKRKLAARSGKQEFAASCEAIKPQIAERERIISVIEAGNDS